MGQGLCAGPLGWANEQAVGTATALSVYAWPGLKHGVMGREFSLKNIQGPDCQGLYGLEQLGFGQCVFPVAAIISHRLGGLKQKKFILSQFWSPEIQTQGVGMAIYSLEALANDPCLPILSTSVSWLVITLLQSLPL